MEEPVRTWEIVDGLWRETTPQVDVMDGLDKCVEDLQEMHMGFGLSPIKTEGATIKPYGDEGETEPDYGLECLYAKREGEEICYTYCPRDWETWIARTEIESTVSVNRRIDEFVKDKVPAVVRTRQGYSYPPRYYFTTYALGMFVGEEAWQDYGDKINDVLQLYFVLCVEKTIKHLVRENAGCVLYWRRTPTFHVNENVRRMGKQVAVSMRLAFCDGEKTNDE